MMIQETNFITITNTVIETIVSTNTLNKIDIIGIERDWITLGITSFGVMASALSVFLYGNLYKR